MPSPIGRFKPLRRTLRAVFLPVELPIDARLQEQTQWCWAACSTNVSRFLNAASSWTQCRVANEELGQASCCEDGSTQQCNTDWYLDLALARTGNFASMSAVAPSWQHIRAEIDAGRPLAVRIGWYGGGGHFVLVTGYRNLVRRQQVDVRDPLFGPTRIPLAELRDRYRGQGSVTHSYWTKG